MLKSRFGNWIIQKTKTSKISLLKKVGLSLDRDREYPLSRLIYKAMVFITSMVFAPLYLRKCNSVGKRSRTRQKPYIENAGRIEFGDDVNINSKNVQTDFITGPNGHIEIGNEVSINFGVSIVSEKKVKLGNRIRIGPYTMILDTDRHKRGERYKWAEGDPVIIEDDVWLATRVMILKGSMIGRGSVIASGSVVSGIIPPYVVAAGMPARIVKFLKTPENDYGFSWDFNNDDTGYSANTYERVKKIFYNQFPQIYRIPFDIKLSPGLVDGWDSVAQVRLTRQLEEEFGITFLNKDWPRLSSVEKICRVIQKYLKEPVNTNYRTIKSQ